MKHHLPLIVAGCIFSLLAVLHGLRLIFKFPAMIAGWNVPSWVSVIAFFAALALALWMFRASRES